MISVDTNILVRAFLEDDEEQTRQAQDFLRNNSASNKLFISSYAILEFAWVLKVKNINRQKIYEAIIILADSPGIIIGQREIVVTAAEKFIKGQADFGDYIIIAEGEYNSCYKLKTFDKVLLKELPIVAC